MLTIQGLTPVSQAQAFPNAALMTGIPGVVAQVQTQISQGLISDWAAQTSPVVTQITPSTGSINTSSGQILAIAEVHPAPLVQAGSALSRVGRKRGRKAKAPQELKRSTPMRKAKSDKQVTETDAAKPTDQNKSENQEEYASCASSSDGWDAEDITEVV